MRLRELNIGCVGGGTGLPSLIGGLKGNPWLRLSAVVTMFDSGGSSGQLRDELGVLPPGDVLKCALALARNEREARNVLLSRLPTLEQHDRLAGHTGGNLLLSMMETYSGDFLAAVDGLRGLLGCRGRVFPVSVERASICAEYADGTFTRGEVEVDAGQASGHEVRRIWLEPQVSIHPVVADAIRSFDAVIIGPGSFFTSLMPPLLVRGVKEALVAMHGPVILISNLLTEGSGMEGFTAADAARWVSNGRLAVRSMSSSPTRAGRRRKRWRDTRPSTRRRWSLATWRPGVEAVSVRSGRQKSLDTIVAGCHSPSGPSSARGCCGTPLNRFSRFSRQV